MAGGLWALFTDGTYATYGTNGSVPMSPIQDQRAQRVLLSWRAASPQDLPQMIQTNLRPTLEQLAVGV